MSFRALSGLAACLLGCTLAAAPPAANAAPPELANRPQQLVREMAPGQLRERLQGCAGAPLARHPFSIGHRGAPLGFPEHTRESYTAAGLQGAGRIECDATPTRDGVLVCRHAQCDLHSTTDILLGPLAGRCRQPFSPADPAHGRPAAALCCSSDLSLAEFKQLRGRNDLVDPAAGTLQAYLAPGGTDRGTLLTHAESIRLIDSLGADMIPELKRPDPGLALPQALERPALARQLIGEYLDAGIAPERVTPQSYVLDDLRFWLAEFPAFGVRAAWLDPRAQEEPTFDPRNPASWKPSMADLVAAGVKILAPPMPVLLDLEQGRIVPSAYARAARAAGLRLVSWTTERSGPLEAGGGFYYASIRAAIHNDGDIYPVIDVLAREVGIEALFSDWPATTTYYANCMLPQGQ
jgi:glycerophosphoryl diester phosphodiesterase